MPNESRRPPGVSIVITSSNDTVDLRRCLERFAAVWAAAHAEVIVVHGGSPGDLAALAQRFPTIVWLVTESRESKPDLRRLGCERSNRDIVLFLDHRDSVRCEWAATFCRNWPAWTETGGRIIDATCGVEDAASYPYLSVVMPARNGGPSFLLALQALALSDLPQQYWELVIVDDGSTDETVVVGAQYADKLLRLRDSSGPGYARNRGFELTLGDYVAFINADVMVAPDMLRNGVTALTQQPDVGAIFGSCDASAMPRGFLSQYRSLVQRYYHRREASDTRTFSSACGIVRSSIFASAGGYDEWHFSRRQLEDFELAQRIRGLGERIVLQPDIRATHLRKWTLRRMIATEIFDRAVPWMRLVKRHLSQAAGGAPTRRVGKGVNIVLAWLGLICAVRAWSAHSLPWGVAAAACVAVMIGNSVSQLAFFARERGLGFAAASVPLDFLYYLIAGVGVLFGWIARQAVGEPTPGAVAEAFVEMGVRRWPPVPVKRVASRPSASTRQPLGPSAPPELPILSQEPRAHEQPNDNSRSVE